MTTQAKSSVAALALVAALGLGASTAAQAGGYGYDNPDVFWSVAMSQPGLRVAVSNMPAAPVIYERRHVHVHPQPVYVPPPRVVYLPPPAYHHHHPGRGHAYGHWRDSDDHHERREFRGEHRGGDRYAHGRGGHPRGPAPHLGR